MTMQRRLRLDRPIGVPGLRCGESWFKVGRSGITRQAPKCFSANTSTHSMTRTGITLPAKFRASFAAGVVVTRGMDGCLYAYRLEDWDKLVDSRLAGLDPLSQEGRRMHRFFFSGAAEAELDKQGRVMIPGRPHRARRAGPERRRRRSQGPPGDLGRRRLAQRDERGRRERRRCCRTSCNQTRLITFPSWPRRCESSSRSGPVRPSSTRPSARAATLRSSPPISRAPARFIAVDRDPTVKPYYERFRRRTGVQSRLLRGEASVILDQLAENGLQADAILLDLGVSSMQIDRPERGFSYAVDAPLDMRMDPTAETSAADLVNDWPERDLISIFRRYGEERYSKQIARAICASPQAAADRAHGRAGRADPLRHPRSGALRRRPSREARLPGAPYRGQRRARRARGGSAGRLRHASPRRAARGDRVPLARGPDRQALLPEAREGLHLPARLPDLRLRAGARAAPAEPAGDSPERATRSPPTRAPPPPGCAPW